MYDVVIEQGHSLANDRIIEFLKEKIGERDFIDIGCNTGYLIEACGHGRGCDLSQIMVDRAREKGLDVILGDALALPYKDKETDMCVLSCVLEQVESPDKALSEALRVGNRVIGISPHPKKSVWGEVGGTNWVKSVTSTEYLKEVYTARIYPFSDTHFYFEIDA